MSHDLARLIWEKAKDAERLIGEDLRVMFKKKVRLDTSNLIKIVSDLVAGHIQTQMQPLYSQLDLAETDTGAIFGATAQNSNVVQISTTKIANLDLEEQQFVSSKGIGLHRYHVSSGAYESRILIQHVINVIGLEWYLKYTTGGYHIIISWGHWPQRDE